MATPHQRALTKTVSVFAAIFVFIVGMYFVPLLVVLLTGLVSLAGLGYVMYHDILEAEIRWDRDRANNGDSHWEP